MKTLLFPLLLGATALSSPAMAQDHSQHQDQQHLPSGEKPQAAPMDGMEGMEGMDHSEHTGMEKTTPNSSDSMRQLPKFYVQGSGTARLPGNEDSMHGLHLMSGDWMFMVHGNASLQFTDHTGPRGDSKTYVTSMGMVSASRATDWGQVQVNAMFSLEPAMDPSGYPNLFATGETAHGLPIVDRQHPHDLFMELSVRVDVKAGSGRLFLYGGPVAEPALGPSAFMHRGSASNNPEPPITHHWFDSTHITYGVVTLGYSTRHWQVEASAFRGAEPDERRWNIETPKLDSWSVRGSWTPSPKWALQASYGEIKQPEATHPGEDEHRFTTSLHYVGGGVSAMAAFSSKKRVPGDTSTAWLGEVNWNLDPKNSLFGRFENVSNSELFPDHLDPLHDTPFRVSKFQVGYARHVPIGAFDLTLGGSANRYAKPDALDAAYGRNPWGYTVFMRVSLGS